MNALWNDDFHHAAVVALTGRREAYYTDYLGTPQELISAAKYGYIYQGQHYSWQRQRRGEPALDLDPATFVTFLQNHDQIANSANGARIHERSSPGSLRALTALLLLGPGTPMLFMGQEFAASAPFLYFADHEPGLAENVRRGRSRFLEQFPSLAQPEVRELLNDPAEPATFECCKLDFSERETNAEILRLHRDLLRLRREDPTLGAQRLRGVDGAVLDAETFVLRYFGDTPAGMDDRLLLIALGRDLPLSPAPEPLLAPPAGCHWDVLWSSASVRYGGEGAPPPERADGSWHISGASATVLIPAASRREDDDD